MVKPSGRKAKPAREPAIETREHTLAMLRHWREDVPDDRIGQLVKDALRSFQRALQLRLVDHAVSYGHWAFLRVLWQADGITQRALSEQAGVMEPTTFAALKAMEQLGYVERRQLGDNRKNVYVFLTETGKALREKLVPVALEINEAAVRDVPPDDIVVTRRTLLAIIENLAADEIRCAGEDRRIPSTRKLAKLVSRRRPESGFRE